MRVGASFPPSETSGVWTVATCLVALELGCDREQLDNRFCGAHGGVDSAELL